MVNQQIPKRDVPVASALDLVTRANSHPAFTSVVDVDLEPLANSYRTAILRAGNQEVLVTSAEDVDLGALANSHPPALGRPTIREVVEGFLALRRHQRVKPETLATEGKRLAQFERAMALVGFDHLPADLPPLWTTWAASTAKVAATGETSKTSWVTGTLTWLSRWRRSRRTLPELWPSPATRSVSTEARTNGRLLQAPGGTWVGSCP